MLPLYQNVAAQIGRRCEQRLFRSQATVGHEQNTAAGGESQLQHESLVVTNRSGKVAWRIEDSTIYVSTHANRFALHRSDNVKRSLCEQPSQLFVNSRPIGCGVIEQEPRPHLRNQPAGASKVLRISMAQQ